MILESTEMLDQNTNSPANETLKSDLNSVYIYLTLMEQLSIFVTVLKRITDKICSTVFP